MDSGYNPMIGSPPGNPMNTFNNVVFHHVPNAQAPGLLAAMLVYAFCLGLVSLDLVMHFGYDVSLTRRPGWREPIKAANRFAYYFCRYGSFIFLLLTIIYMNTPGLDCTHYARAINVMWLLPLIFVDVIFVQRTLALYNWKMPFVIVLGFYLLAYVGLSAYSIIEFGHGYQIPMSDFCAYQATGTHEQPHASIFIAYCCVLISLDTLILILSVHRLTEGGLPNLPKVILSKASAIRPKRSGKSEDGSHQGGATSLSALLLKQGVGYFIILELSRLAFLIVYYAVDQDTSYQVLVSGTLVTIGPVMAGMLFRQTTEAVQRTALQRSINTGSHSQSNGPQAISFRSSTQPFSPKNVLPHDVSQVTSTPFAKDVRDRKISSIGDAHGALTDDEEYGAGGYFDGPQRRSLSFDGQDLRSQDIFDRDEKGLRVYVDRSTDLEMQHLPSQRNTSLQYENGTPLPIHRRFQKEEQVSSPSSPLVNTPATLVDRSPYFGGRTHFSSVRQDDERPSSDGADSVIDVQIPHAR